MRFFPLLRARGKTVALPAMTLLALLVVLPAGQARAKEAVEICREAYALANSEDPDLHRIVALYNECLAGELTPRMSAIYHINRGSVLDELGQADLAIKDYNTAEELGYEHHKLYYNRGIALFHLNDFPEAAKDFKQCLAMEPRFQPAWFRLGYCHLAVDQYKSAVAALNKAVELAPEDVYALHALGIANNGLPDYPAALESFERALQLVPDDPTLCNEIAWLLATCPDSRLQDGPRAVRLALLATSAVKNDVAMLDTLAAAQARNGQYEEAAALQTKVMLLVAGQGGQPDPTWVQRLRLYQQGKPYTDIP